MKMEVEHDGTMIGGDGLDFWTDYVQFYTKYSVNIFSGAVEECIALKYTLKY